MFHFKCEYWSTLFYFACHQAAPKPKKAKEVAKAKPEEEKEEPQTNDEVPAENGEAKAEEVTPI